MPITGRPRRPVRAQASIRDGLTWGQCVLAGAGAPWRPGGRTLSIRNLAPPAGHWPVGGDKSAHFVAVAKRFAGYGLSTAPPFPCGPADSASVAADDRRAAPNPGANAAIPHARPEPSGCAIAITAFAHPTQANLHFCPLLFCSGTSPK